MRRKSLAASPYVCWAVLFIVIPVLIAMFYAFTIQTDEGFVFSFENIQKTFDPMFLKVFMNSVWLAVECTIVCLLLGYPTALFMASKQIKGKQILFVLLMVPMWINFLLRTYAWMTILESNGILNTVLTFFGLEPVELLYTPFAVLLGMVYNYLPFMVLPIYTSLTKMDNNLIEAAEDLGANKFNVFTRVTLPLSKSGVISGIIMVFMPALTTFVISTLLGGDQITLIGNIIENQFMKVSDWHMGSALSLIMLIVVLLSTWIFNKSDDDGGGLLF